MRQRSFFSFLAAGVIVLLLVGLAGCNGSISQSPLSLKGSGTTQPPGAAIFVSKGAPVMMSMLVNPDRLQALQGDRELSKLKRSVLANTNIDYKQDIQPWLGNEITLAVTTLDIDRNPENGTKPGYLMALATDNPEKSSTFLELLFSKRALAGADLVTEQYKGVKLIYENSLAGATVGNDFVLFANDPKVLREAINNVQAPDLNLSSSSRYQQATKQLPAFAQAMAFLNLPSLARWQGFELPYQTYDSQLISLKINPKGLLAQTAILAKEETLPTSEQISKTEALQYIPTSAGLAISGSNLSNLGNSNLAQLWKQVKGAISGSGNVNSQLQPLADLQNNWDINLQDDIFADVQGEYAIGLLPSPQHTTPDWVFVVESESTPTLIARLDNIASSKGLSPSYITLDKQKVSVWTQLTTESGESYSIQAKVLGAHTTVDNYEIFSNSLEAMDRTLKAKDNSLSGDRNFRDSIAEFPQPNQGYLYLDWTKSHQILESQIPILKLVEVVGKPFFQNLKSLSVSSYDSNAGLLKGGVFFQLDNL